MVFQLKDIVPWGRSLAEYKAMFALSVDDLEKRILGCGDGPASFNAEMIKRGGTVVSVDPLYAFSVDDIKDRIDETFDEVMRETLKNVDEFVWSHIRSIDELGNVRMKAMKTFLSDYPQGSIEGRYIEEGLPTLSFPDDTFDLAVCSHLLFLYSDHLDLNFHINAITELCRVCGEARIFPLLQLGAVPSPHVQPVCEYFSAEGYEVTLGQVSYEFQRGGNQMLRIRRTKSALPADTNALRP